MTPSVTLICLTADRDEMLERAIECWREQSYPCNLLVYDNGKSAAGQALVDFYSYKYAYEMRLNRTIGELRNAANALVQTDIIAHLDSDDFSHPRRIEEQVKLLMETGADVVGYNEALFWDTHKCSWHESHGTATEAVLMEKYGVIQCAGEAWLYRHPSRQFCLGTSLCYWRRTWEKKPFQALPSSDQSAGEDWVFCAGLKAWGVSSIVADRCVCSYDNKSVCAAHELGAIDGPDFEPRLIASVSERLATGLSRPEEGAGQPWRRASEWDAHCRAVMEGK